MPLDKNALDSYAGAAAKNNDLANLKTFLDCGASASALFEGKSLLDYAVEHNSVDIIKLLFRYKAIPRFGGEGVFPEIVLAAMANKWPLVQAFISEFRSRETDPYKPNFQYGHALIYAVRNGQHQIAEGLIQAGASTKGVWLEDSLLHIAVKNKDSKMVSLLLSYDCDPSIINKDKKTSARLAVELNDSLCQLAFADNGDGYRLYLAVMKNDYFKASQLINKPGIQHFVDWNGNSLLHIAVQYISHPWSMICLLLNQKVNPELKNKAGQTALTLAIDSGNTNSIFALAQIHSDYFDKAPLLKTNLLAALKKAPSSVTIGSIIYEALIENTGKGRISKEIEELIRTKYDAKELVLAHMQTLAPEERLKAINMALNEKTITEGTGSYGFFSGKLEYKSIRKSQSDLNAFFAQRRGMRETALTRGTFKKIKEMNAAIFKEAPILTDQREIPAIPIAFPPK